MTTEQGHRTRRMAITAVAVATAALGVASALFPTSAGASWLTDVLGLSKPQPNVAAGATATPDLLCTLLRICPRSSTTSTATTQAPGPGPATALDQVTTSTVRRTTTTTVPRTTTTAAPKPTCGGATTLPKPGGGRWTCSFQDEFSGPELDRTKWVPQTTMWSGFSSNAQDCYVDSPNNVAVRNGYLVLTSRRESAPFTCQINNSVAYPTDITSGSVSTRGLFAQAYGRFEIRARVTGAPVPGLHEAFWLWPANDKKYGPRPASGEIDIAEIYHSYPDRAMPFLHYNAQKGQVVTRYDCMISDIHAFHTYTAEWTPRLIRILYDDQVCMEATWRPQLPLVHPQPFDQPFMVAITQGLGQPSFAPQNNAFSASTTPLPASTVVDYVRVYK